MNDLPTYFTETFQFICGFKLFDRIDWKDALDDESCDEDFVDPEDDNDCLNCSVLVDHGLSPVTWVQLCHIWWMCRALTITLPAVNKLSVAAELKLLPDHISEDNIGNNDADDQLILVRWWTNLGGMNPAPFHLYQQLQPEIIMRFDQMRFRSVLRWKIRGIRHGCRLELCW